jgi:WD40 repeat protein
MSLAKGEACLTSSCPDRVVADVVGSLLVVRTSDGLEFRAASDGHSVGTVTSSVWWWKIAPDASYVAGGGSTGLTIWGPTGSVLYTRAGDYSQARIFAAPGVLRVANSLPAGSTLETIAVDSGVISASAAFQGTVAFWLQDGEAFVSRLGSTVWVYSKTGQQLDLFSTTFNIAGGAGNRLWALDGTQLRFMTIGGGGAVVASFVVPANAQFIESGSSDKLALLAFASPDSVISRFDLGGPTPVRSDVTLQLPRVTAYAATATSSWWIGTQSGSVLDGASVLAGTPRYVALGLPLSIAGGGNRVAVALGFGDILYFDASTRALLGRIPFQSAQLAISADGTTLAARAADANAYLSDRSIKVFDLATGATKFTWPYDNSGMAVPIDIALSSSGTVLGRLLSTGLVETARVSDGVILQSHTEAYPLQAKVALSPDGSTIAVGSGFVASQIYRNGTLVGAAEGYPVGWLDAGRLLEYRPIGHHTYPVVVDAVGVLIGDFQQSPLRDFVRMQAIDADRFYVPDVVQVFSSTTLLPLWSPASSRRFGVGAVASNRVFYLATGMIRCEPL